MSDDEDYSGLNAGVEYGEPDFVVGDSPSELDLIRAEQKALGKSYGIVWVDIEYNPSRGCGWGSNTVASCTFTKDLIQGLKNKGLKVGVYSNYYQWIEIFGSANACSEISSMSPQLWYAAWDGQ